MRLDTFHLRLRPYLTAVSFHRIVDAPKRDAPSPPTIEAHDDVQLLPIAGAQVILAELPSPRHPALHDEVVPLPAGFDVHGPFALRPPPSAHGGFCGRRWSTPACPPR